MCTNVRYGVARDFPAMLRFGLAFCSALLVLVVAVPPGIALAPAARAAELPAAIPNVYVHTPRDLDRGHPIQVLLTLHGMGGNGEQFGSQFIAESDRNGWLLVSPTIAYG